MRGRRFTKRVVSVKEYFPMRISFVTVGKLESKGIKVEWRGGRCSKVRVSTFGRRDGR